MAPRGSRARRRHPAVVGLSIVALMIASLVAPVEARAAEVYPVPSSGILAIDGHGYGHGRGMSQWGAYGAANAGLTWQQIVGFYYPNTSRASWGNPTIRVNVSSDTGTYIGMMPAGGLQVTSGQAHSNPQAIPTTDPATGLAVTRVEITGTSPVSLSYLVSDGSARLVATDPGQLNVSNPLTGVVQAVDRSGQQATYRGEYRGVSSGTTLLPVAALPMEEYLRGVVPYEVPSSWPTAALSAQAVAARSYAAFQIAHPRSSAFDVYDSTADQVYWGRGLTAATDAAIANAAGVVMAYNGAAAVTQFSASNGGWMAPGAQPYLVAKADPYDGTSANPHRSWSTTITASTFESTWPTIGTFRALEITGRDGYGDWGGRVTSAVVLGAAGSVTVSGDTLRTRLGLKSTYLKPVFASLPSYPHDYSGDGRPDLLGVRADGALMRYPGDGRGHLVDTIQIGNGWSGLRVVSGGAWDSDTIADVLAIRPDGGMDLYRGTPAGLDGPARVGSGWEVMDAVLTVGDFNGDGVTDLLARRRDGSLWMYTADGRGGFADGVRQVGSDWQSFDRIVGPGDFDGDGHPDVVARDIGGDLLLYRGDGRGSWLPTRKAGNGWNIAVTLMSSGDFNGDGHPDLIMTRVDGSMWLYPGDGLGSFVDPLQIGSGWQAYAPIL